ncbi:hypothetical protein KIW84_022697 [Lathyrus oleraceus]|uniref:SET domain-containing protein n=1 Tax=Pisum sativum TaxID=3888 RepID=A0A9D4YBU6_PEA|nr:hypothetical protein KIW84_022697 [Pisum sativum]
MERSRRAILLDIKWACLESLLSIPPRVLKNGIHLEENYTFFSDDTLRCIFGDLVESLENAGGSSVLSMLRSLRMLFELVAKVTPSAVVSCSHVIDAQFIWNMVHSSWILHINYNKRRVASIAALLSSVLHPLLFNDESMHQRDIDATRAGSIAHLINHSCEPVCYSRVICVNGDKHIITFAKRDIILISLAVLENETIDEVTQSKQVIDADNHAAASSAATQTPANAANSNTLTSNGLPPSPSFITPFIATDHQRLVFRFIGPHEVDIEVMLPMADEAVSAYMNAQHTSAFGAVILPPNGSLIKQFNLHTFEVCPENFVVFDQTNLPP